MDLTIALFIYAIIFIAMIIHEYSHGFVAHILGDDTAKEMGRLTLNPFVHIDVLGTIVLPILSLFSAGAFIGWAKPVPYNPFNFRDKKYGVLKVSAAGPVANILMAIVFGIILRLLLSGALPVADQFSIVLIKYVIYINLFLALFNLIPIPPLDGSGILMSLFPNYARLITQVGFFGMFLAIFVAFYFLPPIANFVFLAITGHPY